MDADSQSLTSDPGLFDDEVPGGSVTSSLGESESSINVVGNDDGRSKAKGRRSYNPVPEEAKQSREYVIRRQRNNFAVKRCRTLTKSKQNGLGIKAAGYQSLTHEYQNETIEMNARRKNLEMLFRQHLIESSRLNPACSSSSNLSLEEAIAEEELNRRTFDEKLVAIRQQFMDRLHGTTSSEATSPYLSNNKPGEFSLRFDQPKTSPS